jgi:di/tricarboxylate transporter
MVTPDVLGSHAIAVMLLTLFAMFLFSRDRISLETSSLIILTILVVGFELFPFVAADAALGPRELLSGFGNPALITIVALLICSKALEVTGAVNSMTRILARSWHRGPKFGLLLTMIVAAGASMFMNNTPIVAMFLPLLVAVCIRTRTRTSGVLMPVGYATIIGGMATTIGTSTNLLVVDISAQLGMEKLQMFDFMLPVLIAGSLGVLFLWLIGPRVLPDRTPPMVDTSPRVFRAVLHVTDNSTINGKTLPEALALTSGRLRIERIERRDGLFIARLPTVVLQNGDRLYVRAQPDELKEFESVLRTPLHSTEQAPSDSEERWLAEKMPQQLAEIVVTPNSLLDGQQLLAAGLLQHRGLFPIAVHKPQHRIRLSGNEPDTTDQRRLAVGDVVLVQGARKRIKDLKRSGEALVLDGSVDLPQTSKAGVATALMVSVVAAAAFGILPILVSSLLGVVLCVVTGCIDWRQLRAAVDTNLILMIVSTLGLSTALMATGVTAYMAGLFVDIAGGLPPDLVIAMLMLATALLTEVITNNAAAVLVTPIAFSIAESMGLDVRAVVIAVMFGANMSYLTPVGYQTNLLVLNAGGYRFTDFIRLGLPLQIIMWASLSLLLAAGF